jgi:hypothetical protein
MLGRALSLATGMLVVGCFAAERTLAQENLDAGKTPSQIFAGTCNACHKSPRGLLKTVPPGSLPSFLRQHYTTSPNMAGVLASYLISNGATDTRVPREGSKDAKQEAKQDAKSAAPSDQPDRPGRKQRPATASQEPKPEPSAKPDEGEVPAQATVERGPDGRKLSAKQKLSKHGREEPGKPEATPAGEAAREAAAREDSRPETARPPAETVEPSSETSMTRSDPVPPVTPAPATAAPATPPPLSPAAVSAAVAGTTNAVPAVPLPSAPAPPPAVAAAAPPLPPVAPAGPPVPPISQ